MSRKPEPVQRLQGSDSVSGFEWPSDLDWQIELSDARRVELYPDVIREAQIEGALKENEPGHLKAYGQLPLAGGGLATWQHISRMKGEPPRIGGTEPPSIVCQELATHPVVCSGELSLSRFNLDAHVTGLTFNDSAESDRRAFFDWLARIGPTLAGPTWRALAEQPIWLTARGELLSFAELCLPKRAVRKTLGDHLNVPSAKVLTLSRVRTDGRGPLRLRTTPSEAELRDWYDDRMRLIESDPPPTPEARNRLADLERSLIRLWRLPKLRGALGWLGDRHSTLAASGNLRPVRELHLNNREVAACHLTSDDLATGDRKALLVAIGARTRPSAAAIATALEAGPQRSSALYARLSAYRDALRRGEASAPGLAELPFIPAKDRFCSPSDLAFVGRPDYWGSWKEPFGAVGLAAERQENLRIVGVTGRVPSDSDSKSFCHWVSRQGIGVMTAHLDQLMRHRNLSTTMGHSTGLIREQCPVW